jgi:hypothetical protein
LQYDQEYPGSDLLDVLAKRKSVDEALADSQQDVNLLELSAATRKCSVGVK